HPERRRPLHHRADPAGPVEDRVLAVDVEVDVRRGFGHDRPSLPMAADGAPAERMLRPVYGRMRVNTTAAPAASAATAPHSGSLRSRECFCLGGSTKAAIAVSTLRRTTRSMIALVAR